MSLALANRRLMTLLAVAWPLCGCADEIVGYQSLDSGSTLASGSSGSLGSSDSGDASDVSDASGSGDADLLPDYVAMGFLETIAVSFDDGRNWQEVLEPSSPVEVTHEGLTRGADRIVIVGGFSTLVSTDGITWESYGDNLGYAHDVAYGAGTFVSVGQGRRARSDDAIGWIDERPDDTDFNFQAITFGGGRFVAVGQDLIATSVDGIDWQTTPLAGSKLHAIAFGNDRFVAVSEEGRVVVTTDGQTILSDVTDGPAYGSICFFEGEFVALAQQVVRTSELGQEWREFSVPHSDNMGCGPVSVVAVASEQVRRGDDPLSLADATTLGAPVDTVRYTGPR